MRPQSFPCPACACAGAHTRLGRVERKRIVGSHFNKDGKPKRGYVHESVARQEAARLGMTYYRCDFCDRFHLASPDKT
jgi:hypothetical protein